MKISKRGMGGERKSDKVKGDGESLNNIDPRAEIKNRRYAFLIEYHLLPERPMHGSRKDGPSSSPSRGGPVRRPYSFISVGYSPCTRDMIPQVALEADPEIGQAFTTPVAMMEDCVAVVLETGATGTLVSGKWPDNHNVALDRNEYPELGPYSAQAQFPFRGSRGGPVVLAGDIAIGITGSSGRSTTSVAEADVPAVLRERATEALGGRFDFHDGVLALDRRRGGFSPDREFAGTFRPGRGLI